MEVLLFWIPLLIVIGSLIHLFAGDDANKLDWVVSQNTTLYFIIGLGLISSIWMGVSLGTSWLETNSTQELFEMMWDNFSPVELLAIFFQHYDGGQIILIMALVMLFAYRVTMGLYYNFTGLKDHKVISTYVVSAWYYESWTEKCTRIVTETDGQGKTKTRTETYYVYHPPYWEANLGDGTTISISSSDYRNYCDKFGNQKFEDVLRINQSSIGDGNAYYSKWPETDDTMIPAAYKTDYFNYVTGSKNTILVSNVDETKFAKHLCPDPDIEGSPFGGIEVDRVATPGIQFDEKLAQAIDLKVSKYLARLGTEKDVNIMFYFTDQDINFWFALHEIRKGGRFNEVLVVVGLVPGTQEVAWCKTMAWDNGILCGNIDAGIVQLGTIQEPDAICDIVTNSVNCHWVQPNMDKYRYLASDISLPWGYIALGVLMVTLVCAPVIAYFYHTSFSEMLEATGQLFEN